MRIGSDLAHFTAALGRVGARLEDYQAAQTRLATGRRLQRPSDDVAGTGRAMALRAALSSRRQEARNAEDGLMWIGLADTKLQSVADRLQRARELAVRGATTTGGSERAGIAAEVAGLRAEILALANSRHGGRGLFAGYALDDAVTNVAGTWTYTGDAGQVERRVGDAEVVAVNVTAADAFGFTAGSDVFTILDDLETALLAGDTPAVDAAIDAVDGGLDRVLAALTALGTAANRIESAQFRNAGDVVELTARLSEVEDVDLSEAVMELQLRETAYQAALAAFTQSSQPSLLDFLT